MASLGKRARAGGTLATHSPSVTSLAPSSTPSESCKVQIVNGKLVVRVDHLGGHSGPIRSRCGSSMSSTGDDDLEDEHYVDGHGAVEFPSWTNESSPVASTSKCCQPTEDSGHDKAAAVQKSQGSVHSRSRSRSRSQSHSRSRSVPVAGRPRVRYFCEYAGCDKSYSKPVRLAEHVRSHTGERPFRCTYEGCESSYLRETHLQAHLRSHSTSIEDRPLACSEPGCDKRFWTTQHLSRHVKQVHEQDKDLYKCMECDETFNKHHKLRSHVAEQHNPKGTLPFICTHHDCNKSFSTGSKLRSHSKVHDENRYACLHESHAGGQLPKFPTWSALQAHNKLDHPPTCSHPGCKGKRFASHKILKQHTARWHVGSDSEASEEADVYHQKNEEGDAHASSNQFSTDVHQAGESFTSAWKPTLDTALPATCNVLREPAPMAAQLSSAACEEDETDDVESLHDYDLT